MARCTRCSSTPVVVSLDVHLAASSRAVLLCAWCAGPVFAALFTVDEIDDITIPLDVGTSTAAPIPATEVAA